MVFEFGTMLACTLMGSTFVGDLLINLRSVYRQDKALSIGFWMSLAGIFVYVFGKFLYEAIADTTCLHWSLDKSVCHLHESTTLGDYMCYLTALLLALGLLLKILVWVFSKNLRLYNQLENEIHEGAREMQEIIRTQAASTTSQELNEPAESNTEINDNPIEIATTSQVNSPSELPQESNGSLARDEDALQKTEPRLKYGPLGPGDRRTRNKSHVKRSRSRNLDTDNELDSSSDESRVGSSPAVAYAPLDIDSDVESELSSIDPRSRRRIHSKDYEPVSHEDDQPAPTSPFKREFPNPDNYEDPRSVKLRDRQNIEDGSWPTNSFQFAKPGEAVTAKKGDFNEVGIPVNPILEGNFDVPQKAIPEHVPVKSLINQYERSSPESLDVNKTSSKSDEDSRHRNDGRTLPGSIPLIAMAARPSSRGQTSSGFSSSADDHDRNADVTSDGRESQSLKVLDKRGKKAICTDL